MFHFAECYTVYYRQFIYQPETYIMSRFIVFGLRITESRYYIHILSLLKHSDILV